MRQELLFYSHINYYHQLICYAIFSECYHRIYLSYKYLKAKKMPGFITPQGLKHLDFYQYKSGKYTWLDNALQTYWNYVVSLVPLTVAPNLITFIGWLLLLSATLIMLCYDFTFKKTIPSWCFYYAAFCLWSYSTLDAIDGKQARRTKSSSPLGQLFDHGCDAFSVSFLVIQIGEAAQLEYEQVFMIYMATYTAFWLANWNQYNTGVLKTNVGQFGVTECQIIITIVFILTGIFGQSFWKITLAQLLPASITSRLTHKLFVTAFKMNIGGALSYYLGILIIALAIFQFCRTMIKSQRKLKPILECFSLMLIMPLFCAWMWFSFFRSYIGIVLFSFGLLMSLIVCKMIISSVTRMELHVFHIQIIPLMVATGLMALCQHYSWHKGQIFVFWTFLTIIVVISLRFLSNSIKQLSTYLGIYCFSLEKRPRSEIIDSNDKTQ